MGDGLRIALENSEVVVFSGRRPLRNVRYSIAGTDICLVKKAKYLGVWVDSNHSFGSHVAESRDKAERLLAAISRLMGITAGPKEKKRKVIATTVTSVLLYAVPVWRRAFDVWK